MRDLRVRFSYQLRRQRIGLGTVHVGAHVRFIEGGAEIDEEMPPDVARLLMDRLNELEEDAKRLRAAITGRMTARR